MGLQCPDFLGSMLFTEADQQVLAVQRYLHPHPLVQRKMEALWLKSHDIDEKTILQLTSVSRATLFRYYNDYREGGTEKLKQVNFHQPKSELDPHAQTLEAHFRKHPPATVKQAANDIHNTTLILPHSSRQ